MSLKAFDKPFHVGKGNLNVVICINQNLGHARKSPINQMLEDVQLELKKELPSYEAIHVAFVYETPLLNVKLFEILTEETPVYYKEPCEYSETHNMKQLFFMGLVLLEKQQKVVVGESRFYLLTDERFSRVHINEIVQNSRFSNLKFKPVLYTNQPKDEKDLLVQYFNKYGDVREFFSDTK